MITGKLTHPQIVAALARAGHGSRVLVSDGNCPHSTARGPNAEVVYLNLAAADIAGPTVVVHADAVPNPTAVRFGWAAVPDLNLFNADGLPASPFTTEGGR